AKCQGTIHRCFNQGFWSRAVTSSACQLEAHDISYLAQVLHVMRHVTRDDLLESHSPGAEMPAGSRPRPGRRLFQDGDRFKTESPYFAEQFTPVPVDEITRCLLGFVVEPGQVRVLPDENGSIAEVHGLELKVSQMT